MSEGVAVINAKKMLTKYFDAFTKKQYDKLQNRLQLSDDELKETMNEILKLNPMLSGQSVLKKKPAKPGRNLFRLPMLLSILALTFMIPFNTIAQGNLLITPRRVVFDGSKRTITLNLANIGNDTATYSISLVQIRMTKEGAFETITEPDPGQKFADKNLRFFPRSVTLPPNEAQVVKVQLIKASKLSPGEYRSHFYFRSVPKVNPLGEEVHYTMEMVR